MKAGYFTDLHFRGDTPEGRIDNYTEAIYAKLEEMGEIWKDHKVDEVWFGGDLGHSYNLSRGLVNDLISIFKSWNIPIIGVVGSHDYIGYQMQSLRQTALGTFINSHIIEIVGGTGFPNYINKTYLDGTNVTLVGTPHSYYLVDDINNLYAPYYEESADYQVQIIHGDINHKVVPWPHVLIKDIHTESNLVLSGHIHPGWESPVAISGKIFFNPGSIGRVENSGGKVRMPRVCIVNINKSDVYKCKIKSVYLQCATENPFKTKLQENEVVIQDVNKLLTLVKANTIEVMDIKKQLPSVAKQLGYDNSIIELCFQLLEEV